MVILKPVKHLFGKMAARCHHVRHRHFAWRCWYLVSLGSCICLNFCYAIWLYDCCVSSYDSYICNSLRKTSTSKSCWFNHHSETLKRRSLFFLPGPRWLLGEYDSICFNLSHWRLHGSWSLRLHFLNRISIWYPAQILIKVREHYNCFTGLDGCNHKALVASCYLYFHWSLL